MSVEVELLVLMLGVVFALSVLIELADYADRRQARWARWGVRLVVWMGALVYVSQGVGALLAAYAEPPSPNAPAVRAAWGGFGFTLLIVGGLLVLTLPQGRRKLARLLSRYRFSAPAKPAPVASVSHALLFPQEGEPLFPQQLNYYTTQTAERLKGEALPATAARGRSWRGFDPNSEVHALAAALVWLALGGQFVEFMLGGGLAGVAEEFEGGLSVVDLLLNMLPMLVLPFVGVGLGTRRTWRQALQRLGLGRLGWGGVRAALGVTFLLLMWMVAVGIAWQVLMPQSLYEKQTQATDALAEGVTTLGVAFTLSATAAIGEEITFRGALQPIFGFWATALCFTLFHAQYAFTPAWLLIFGVAVALGWVRERYNTTVAILTHFLYNFIQLLFVLA